MYVYKCLHFKLYTPSSSARVDASFCLSWGISFELNNRECWLCVCAHVLSRLSHVRLFATPWNVAVQAPLSMGFSRPEYWSGLPCPPPGDLPKPRNRTHASCNEGGFFTTEPPGKPTYIYNLVHGFYAYCMYDLLHILRWYDNPVSIVITLHPEPRG